MLSRFKIFFRIFNLITIMLRIHWVDDIIKIIIFVEYIYKGEAA